jgi:hypothetical protein
MLRKIKPLNMNSISNSHLTAVSRKTLPLPVRWLLSQGMIHGHVLDYGCGRCKPLNDSILAKAKGIKSVTSYDPYHFPTGLDYAGINGLGTSWSMFDVVLCTYVLCTLPELMEKVMLKVLQHHLLPNGVAYVTIRNDEPQTGWGRSSKGTLQRQVSMPFLYELRRTPQYSTYLLTPQLKLI